MSICWGCFDCSILAIQPAGFHIFEEYVMCFVLYCWPSDSHDYGLFGTLCLSVWDFLRRPYPFSLYFRVFPCGFLLTRFLRMRFLGNSATLAIPFSGLIATWISLLCLFVPEVMMMFGTTMFCYVVCMIWVFKSALEELVS